MTSELRDMQIDLVKQRREKGHRFYVLYYGADGHKYWSGPHRQDVAESATAMADRHAAGFIVEDRRYFEDTDDRVCPAHGAHPHSDMRCLDCPACTNGENDEHE